MTSQEIALREAVNGTVAQLRDPDFEQQVALAVPENVSPRKLLRAAATAVLDNPNLAREDLRQTLIRATLKTAQDGLLPDGREAAFVIFEGRNPSVAYMPMVGGLRKIAAEHGIAIQTGIIHENDEFDPDFDTGEARFRRARLGTDRGKILGAFATAQHKDGRRWIEVMDVAEIEKVRKVSRAKDSGPWKDWWERMAEKTVARRLYKSLPLDPKDAERVHRVLDASADPVEVLYGPNDRQAGAEASSSRARPVEATRAAGEVREESPSPPPALANPAEPIPDEADILDPTADKDEPLEGEIIDEDLQGDQPPDTGPVFQVGKHAGIPLEDILALGDEGLAYLRWAHRSWKDEPLRSALDALAEKHPEIKKRGS